MKKMFKILGFILLVIIILIVISLIKNARISKYNEEHSIKNDDELLGERFKVPRDNGKYVNTILYKRETSEKVPIIFNVHGGAFIAGNADTLDTQSKRLSDDNNAMVVNINYTLAKDGYDMNYAVDEVKDTIIYFKNHADEYNIDTNKFFAIGYSAGGYHVMNAVLKLNEENESIAGEILCYSFIGEIIDKYNSLDENIRKNYTPTLFILADNDPISEGSLKYEKVLKENDVSVDTKKYKNAKHGFIEENNPEYDKLKNVASKSEEQEKLARDAEKYIKEWIQNKIN